MTTSTRIRQSLEDFALTTVVSAKARVPAPANNTTHFLEQS